MNQIFQLLKDLVTGSGLPRPINYLYQAALIGLLTLALLIQPNFSNSQWLQTALHYAHWLEPYFPELAEYLPRTTTARSKPTPSIQPGSYPDFPGNKAPHQLSSFAQAKNQAWKIYAVNPFNPAQPVKDFYCGCDIHGNRLDLKSCGYVPRKNANRAQRVEWEHIVPAWTIGHQRQCWQDGGRKNCAANDPVFRVAEADLHNLVPVVGEVNGDRSNFVLTEWREAPSQYGRCEFVVDFKQRKAMPPEHTRGAIARSYLYMADTYQLRLSKSDRRIYEIWHKKYPVNAWEKWRNQANACVQKNANPYVGPVDLRRCES